MRFTWWWAVAFSHRWLGIAGCLLFIVWFVSGIAMMYVRMPAVTPAERFAHLPALDAATVRVPLSDAAKIAGATTAVAARLTMLGNRPVYRFGGRSPSTVFADRPERLEHVGEEQARLLAGAFAPDRATALRHIATVAIPDQWTLQSRTDLPLHQFQLGDQAGTTLYVSSRSGEVVMETTRHERFWAYVGPVAHWLYLPVLRRNSALWTSVIIWLSIAGCLLCITGLVAGLWRFAPWAGLAARGGRAMSPYAGWMKWHHYAGLVFGVITLTWTFSGLLSMGPFPLLASEGITAGQRLALTGEPPGFDGVSASATRVAIDSASRTLTPKELSLTTLRGRAYWIASEDPTRRVVVPVAHPETVIASFARSEMDAIARDAMPGTPIADMAWLDDYDDYYYDRERLQPLPVLRARYADADRTWIYLDPSRGSIALVVRRPDRVNRWLYQGLHSLDFAWLRKRRPLWDVVLIMLSIGGIAGAATSLVPGWRRLRRHGRLLFRIGASS